MSKGRKLDDKNELCWCWHVWLVRPSLPPLLVDQSDATATAGAGLIRRQSSPHPPPQAHALRSLHHGSSSHTLPACNNTCRCASWGPRTPPQSGRPRPPRPAILPTACCLVRRIGPSSLASVSLSIFFSCPFSLYPRETPGGTKEANHMQFLPLAWRESARADPIRRCPVLLPARVCCLCLAFLYEYSYEHCSVIPAPAAPSLFILIILLGL